MSVMWVSEQPSDAFGDQAAVRRGRTAYTPPAFSLPGRGVF